MGTCTGRHRCKRTNNFRRALRGTRPGAGGQHLGRALDSLDTFFAIDLYINETNKHAHYGLPATTMYEREDMPVQFWDRFIRPSIRVTAKVVEPPGEWMHNARKLMRDSRRHSLRIHPTDTTSIGVADGEDVTSTSAATSLTVAATVTDEMTPGTWARPHGWGHNGGWTGSSVLNGIPVRLPPALVEANARTPSLAD